MNNCYAGIVDIGKIDLAMAGCRLSFNRTDKTDSTETQLGINDAILAKKLIHKGASHAKFMRCISITIDCTMPLYWWKQFDQYKIGTTTLSTSTMHSIHKQGYFGNDHFSTEIPDAIVSHLNRLLREYRTTQDKEVWLNLIGVLPSAYLQRRMVFTNLEVVRNITQQRRGHKLPEWGYFIERMENQLLYANLKGLIV